MDYVKAQLALAQFTLNRLNRKHINIHALTDFTYLKDKRRVLSFAIPIGERAMPLKIKARKISSYVEGI